MLVRWTEPAVRDFTHICDYISAHGSPTVARRVALAIYKSIDTLTDFPELGRTGRKADTRELVFSGLPYIAIYRIGENGIEVLRILHAAQQWPL
jgi:toxin ParE1/3/4